MPQVVIFGASRQGRVVLEILRAQGSHEVLGFLDDDPTKHGQVLGGLPVLGGMAWLEARASQALMAIVAIGSNDARVAVGEKLRAHGIELVNAVHPSAVLASDVRMGTGNVVCPGAILITGTRLEDDVIVNTAASIDHDSLLQTGAQVAPGVHTAGCVTVGRCAFVGVGAVLGPSVTIGERSIVGAGSAVLGDVPANVIVVGTPAQVVRVISGALDWRQILGGRQPGR